MSQRKKQIRANFRTVCLKRDKHRCVTCNTVPADGDDGLDVHHITDRNELPNGGYVKENGISLCETCHILAEKFHETGISHPGFAPEDLYAKIGSNKELAYQSSLRL